MPINMSDELFLFVTIIIILALILICTYEDYDMYRRPVRHFRLLPEQYKRYMAPTVTRLH
jgi:hypothetical protein